MRINIDSHIKDNIKHRYMTTNNIDYDKRGKSVIDKFFPSCFIYNQNISKNAAFISKFLSIYTGSKHIYFNDLITCFIDSDTLLKLLSNIKQKKLNISLIGYGGMGINLIHFISLLSYSVDIKYIFRSLQIFEDDNLSFSNVFRIYKDITKYSSDIKSNNKLELFDEYNLSKEIKLLKRRFTPNDIDNNQLYIGAPDFATRTILHDSNFIFTGHNNDTLMLISSPIVSESLTIESYGSINLTTFFLNLLSLTIEFLKQLSSIDPKISLPKNTTLFNYSILEDIKRIDMLNANLKYTTKE